MKPYKITLYLYAESDEEAQAAQQALHDFVQDARERGAVVSARRIVQAVKTFSRIPLVLNFFGNGK